MWHKRHVRMPRCETARLCRCTLGHAEHKSCFPGKARVLENRKLADNMHHPTVQVICACSHALPWRKLPTWQGCATLPVDSLKKIWKMGVPWSFPSPFPKSRGTNVVILFFYPLRCLCRLTWFLPEAGFRRLAFLLGDSTASSLFPSVKDETCQSAPDVWFASV
jgi:hypothetical protein